MVRFEVDELNVCLYSGSRLTVILSDELHFDTSRQGDGRVYSRRRPQVAIGVS